MFRHTPIRRPQLIPWKVLFYAGTVMFASVWLRLYSTTFLTDFHCMPGYGFGKLHILVPGDPHDSTKRYNYCGSALLGQTTMPNTGEMENIFKNINYQNIDRRWQHAVRVPSQLP